MTEKYAVPILATAYKSMQDADAMHDRLCATYGETSDVAMYALQQSIAAFLIFCELERLMQDS